MRWAIIDFLPGDSGVPPTPVVHGIQHRPFFRSALEICNRRNWRSCNSVGCQCLKASIWRDSPSDHGQNYSRVFSRWNLQCTSFCKSATRKQFPHDTRLFLGIFSFHLISSHFYWEKRCSCITGTNKIVYSMATPSVVILSKRIFLFPHLCFFFLRKSSLVSFSFPIKMFIARGIERSPFF